MRKRENGFHASGPVSVGRPLGSAVVHLPARPAAVEPECDPAEIAEYEAMLEFQKVGAESAKLASKGRRGLPDGW